MISTEVEARATLPTYMTYPDTWRTKQQPPEFLRPAPKPLTQLRYNGINSPLVNGGGPPSTTTMSTTAIRCLPNPNLPPTPSPSPSTPNSLVRNNNSKYSPPMLTSSNSNSSCSSSPVNLSASHKDDMPPQSGLPPLTADDLQYTAYRIYTPGFVPSPYHASPYAVYAAAAAAASSPYALLPPHHPAAPRSAPYIPTATVAPPLSNLIDPTSYNSMTTSANGGTYISPNHHHSSLKGGGGGGPSGGGGGGGESMISGGSITSGTSAKSGGISSGTSLLRERRPPHQQQQQQQFKIPSGKEGSLKHRILTRPEETTQALDLQQKGSGEGVTNTGRKRLCATLSPPPPTLPPPISSLSPKQPPLQYLKQQHTLPIPPPPQQQHSPHLISSKLHHSPNNNNNNNNNNSNHNNNTIFHPPPPAPNGFKPPPGPLITGGTFTRGTFIQLGGGELRRVEDMRTEDFVLSAERSPALRLAESTVVRIVENRVTGGVTVTLSYNERRTQADVECNWEHPYFVMGATWASCKPDLTYQYYGLRANHLQVGDVLVSLTPRETISALPNKTTVPTTATTNSQNRTTTTPPSNNINSISNVNRSHSNSSLVNSIVSNVNRSNVNSSTVNSSNVNSYNSHYRSPSSTTSNNNINNSSRYVSTGPYSANSLLLRNGYGCNNVSSSTSVGDGTTMTTATGTAMTARPVTYGVTTTVGGMMMGRQPNVHVQQQQHVMGQSSGSSCRSMSPDSLARKRRWSVPDQGSDEEQPSINRRSKTE